MNARQLRLIEQLIAIRAFLHRFAALLAHLVPASIDVELERLIAGMQWVDERQRERKPTQLRARRNGLRHDLLTKHIDQILSAIRASGLTRKFTRYQNPRRFRGRRLVIYTDFLVQALDYYLKDLHLPEGFIDRTTEMNRRYDSTFLEAEAATEQAPDQTAWAARYETQARAMIAHIHTLIAPHIAGLEAELEWKEVKALPSHHGPSTPRLAGPKTPKGLLPSGPTPDESQAPRSDAPPSPLDEYAEELPDDPDIDAVGG